MRQVFAIGNNYIRQSWYIAVFYLLYAALLTWLGRNGPIEGLAITMATEGLFLLGISVVIAVAGVPNDQRSRRILTVLSKGISRAQYLAGMLYGSFALIAVATVLSALSWWGMAVRNDMQIPPAALLRAVVVLLALSLLLICAGLLGVSFLNSKFAIIVPVLVWVLPMMVAWFGGPQIPLPHQGLLEQLVRPFAPLSSWAAVGGTLGEAALLFMAAVALFGRKDITVAAE